MGDVVGIRNIRMARKIQSNINGIWENEIIAMTSKNIINTDMEYLDELTKLVLRLEDAYTDFMEKHDLIIVSNKTIHKCDYPGIPRRFDVIRNTDRTKVSNSPLTVWKEFYDDIDIERASFIMLYNAYVRVFKIGKIMEYDKGTLDAKSLKVHKIHVLSDSTTVADMYDIDTKKPYRFNMTKDIVELVKKGDIK